MYSPADRLNGTYLYLLPHSVSPECRYGKALPVALGREARAHGSDSARRAAQEMQAR